MLDSVVWCCEVWSYLATLEISEISINIHIWKLICAVLAACKKFVRHRWGYCKYFPNVNKSLEKPQINIDLIPTNK